MNNSRRDFLKGTFWKGAAAMAAGCMTDDMKILAPARQRFAVATVSQNAKALEV